jgi:hypothetical protein
MTNVEPERGAQRIERGGEGCDSATDDHSPVMARVGPPVARRPASDAMSIDMTHQTDNREPIDQPPVGREGHVGPEWAVQDRESRRDTKPDPPGVLHPVSHDDTEPHGAS